MKVIAPLLMALIVSVGLHAQDRNDLKGPKAKNWKLSVREISPIVNPSPSKIQGPNAKNLKRRTLDLSHEPVLAKASRNRLKGPKAKNWKPE